MEREEAKEEKQIQVKAEAVWHDPGRPCATSRMEVVKKMKSISASHEVLGSPLTRVNEPLRAHTPLPHLICYWSSLFSDPHAVSAVAIQGGTTPNYGTRLPFVPPPVARAGLH